MVFRLTTEEQKRVEQLVVECNCQLEERSGGSLRDATSLLVLKDVTSDHLILNEVAILFQAAGYLVEVIPGSRGSTEMIRLK